MIDTVIMPHANRSRRDDAPDRSPGFAEVRTARERAGLTQSEAARAAFVTLNAWQRWELDPGESIEARRMPANAWWLFRLRTGQAALADLPPLNQRS